MNYIRLAQNIKNARKERHYTQEQLAELVNCSTVFISQIETGVRIPSLETLYNISKVLFVTIDSLISSPDENTAFYGDNIVKLIENCTDDEKTIIFNTVKSLCNDFNRIKKSDK